MDVYFYIASIGLLCCIVLGTYVLFQDREKLLNRLFFLMSIALGMLVFEGNSTFTANTLEMVILRYRVSNFFYAICFALNLHFYTVFTKRKLKSWQAVLIYIPALVIIINPFIGQPMFANYVLRGDLWAPIPAYGTFGLIFCIIYNIVYLIIPIFFMEQYRRKTKLNKEKRQAIIINTAFFITTIFASTSMFLFPFFDIHYFSRLSPNAFLIYCFAIFYAVFKLKFMNLSPSMMADEIIEHIGEMIILLGNDFRIIMGNTRVIETLGIPPGNLKKRRYYDIIRDNESIDSTIKAYRESAEKDLFVRINYLNNDEEILTDTYISRIHDKYRDPVGFLVVSKVSNWKYYVQKAYKITDREFEVIDLLLSGYSNKLVGERLGITERTVEAHCLHIYSKIGLRGRIELFKFANEFNLLPKN